jgi:hypothetical protein
MNYWRRVPIGIAIFVLLVTAAVLFLGRQEASSRGWLIPPQAERIGSFNGAEAGIFVVTNRYDEAINYLLKKTGLSGGDPIVMVRSVNPLFPFFPSGTSSSVSGQASKNGPQSRIFVDRRRSGVAWVQVSTPETNTAPRIAAGMHRLSTPQSRPGAKIPANANPMAVQAALQNKWAAGVNALAYTNAPPAGGTGSRDISTSKYSTADGFETVLAFYSLLSDTADGSARIWDNEKYREHLFVYNRAAELFLVHVSRPAAATNTTIQIVHAR